MLFWPNVWRYYQDIFPTYEYINGGHMEQCYHYNNHNFVQEDFPGDDQIFYTDGLLWRTWDHILTVNTFSGNGKWSDQVAESWIYKISGS